MILVPPRSTRTYTLFHYTALVRSRADRLVGLLRVRLLRLVLARRVGQVGVAVVAGDERAGAVEGFLRQGDAVGSHIGDEADGLAADVDALVKALRHPQDRKSTRLNSSH